MTRRSSLLRILLGLLCVVSVSYAGLVALRILWPFEYADIVAYRAADNALPFDLVAAVVFAESRFDPSAVSPRGALGLMQIMPSTAAWIAEQLGQPVPTNADLHDPALNTHLGTWYLRHLLDRFGGVESALAAYNAGPSNVERWRLGEGEPFAETTAFVRRVLSARPIYRFYDRFRWVVQITPSITF
jgi:soluble lytic murein transglycosylase